MSAATYAPTAEQQTALNLFQTGESLAIEAGAGTGKTSTLLLLAESTNRRGQYLAFNRSIVEESKTKFPKNVACNTAHSLAMRSYGRKFAHRLPTKRMKSTDIARILNIRPIDLQVPTASGETNHKQLGPAFLAGLAMRAIKVFCQTADAEPSERHVPYIDGIDLPPGSYENNNLVARHLLPALRAIWADANDVHGVLPYDHAYYLKGWQLSGPRIDADFILFDEAQDANPVMVAIVAAQTHAQLVWVGDSQQQIYTFTGAVNALQKVGAKNTAYLTQSFRFGPAVAEVANTVLAQLASPLKLRGFEQIESRVEPVEQPDAYLARTNAAAVTAMLNAIGAGQTAHLVGGGGEVIAFAKAAQELMTVGRTAHPELACFDGWADVQQYVEQDEQGSDLRLMVRLIDEFGVETIVDALTRMPKEDEADIVVSTAHKSKGREWDTVALAGDFPEEPKGEELRLLYVAVTRAKLVLDITQVGVLVNGFSGDLSDAEAETVENPAEGVDGPQTANDGPDEAVSPDEFDGIDDCDESVLAELEDAYLPEPVQLALGELGEALMNDSPACYVYIERAIEHLRKATVRGA